MSGVKGKSGGARPGPHPGRPANSKRLKMGDTFYVSRTTPDGSLAGELWKVETASRGKLIFSCGNETITLTN